ncbi:MAG: 16S rRNA (guanine(527)-N(7))-methyltransferase RsmG [Bacilli bacterium]|nr:16S rRNA (guanine(527)-N(7))-methyltransferase RsmG [Bacilli bacterium]
MTYQELEKEFNINAKQVDKFLTYLLETNKKMNLTAITNKEEMISKHIYDSLLISKAYDFKNKTILDVGSGGGFPGIPLAMLYPTSHFVLVDSTMKKVKYLDEVAKALNLTNVEVKCARVEELNEKEKYDVVIARALAELRIYLELVTYLVKVNGNVIALKGKNANDELAASDNAIKKLNLSLNKIQATAIPTGEKRMNLIFTKIKSTDKSYPREFSQIKKRPL